MPCREYGRKPESHSHRKKQGRDKIIGQCQVPEADSKLSSPEQLVFNLTVALRDTWQE